MRLVLLLLALAGADALFKHRLHPHDDHEAHGASGEDAAFVTPLLAAGKVLEAQALTRVEGITGWDTTEHDMHSGFFTIDKKANSNTFFWFSEALDGNKDAPILLWLQGGPGASSLFGLFTEIGPFNVNANFTAVPREITWNQHYHLIFLDNPLGTGFSFTDDVEAMATNQTTVGRDIYRALRQFFQLMPHLQSNDFYVTGESYAGKYVPAASYTIHKMNQDPNNGPRINLKGLSIGDGAMDPKQQFKNFGSLLWYTGMVDESERAVFDSYEAKMQAAWAAGDYKGAFHQFDMMLNGDRIAYPTYYANVTGMATNYFNFEQGPGGSSLTQNHFIDWLKTPAARRATHTGAVPYAVLNATVEYYLLEDWMHGVTEFLIPLLEAPGVKVLVYSGQNDIILGPPLTEQFLGQLPWSGLKAYNAAKKKVWTVPVEGGGTDLGGYARTVGDFTQVVVRGAGHMVPGDQPARAIDMLDRFINGKPF